jgi:hypothetical protein
MRALTPLARGLHAAAGDRGSSLNNPPCEHCDELSRRLRAAEMIRALAEPVDSLLPEKRDDLQSVKAQMPVGKANGWRASAAIACDGRAGVSRVDLIVGKFPRVVTVDSHQASRPYLCIRVNREMPGRKKPAEFPGQVLNITDLLGFRFYLETGLAAPLSRGL